MKQRYGYTRGAVQTATEITDKFCTRYLHAYHDNKTPFEHPKTCYVYFEADAWEKLLALADNSYEFGELLVLIGNELESLAPQVGILNVNRAAAKLRATYTRLAKNQLRIYEKRPLPSIEEIQKDAHVFGLLIHYGYIVVSTTTPPRWNSVLTLL